VRYGGYTVAMRVSLLGAVLLVSCASASRSPSTQAPPAPPDAEAVPEPAATITRQTVALAIILDRSGSMRGEKLEMAQRASQEALDELDAGDYVTVLAFDSQPLSVVPLRRLGDRAAVRASIDAIRPAGGTEYLAVLQQAHATLLEVEDARRRVLFLSDGVGPPHGVADEVRQMRDDGIVVSTVGIGEDYDPELLGLIAREGGGRFHPVSQLATLATVFRAEVVDLIAAP
jgi:Ca-activated chloride channel family protein